MFSLIRHTSIIYERLQSGTDYALACLFEFPILCRRGSVITRLTNALTVKVYFNVSLSKRAIHIAGSNLVSQRGP